MIVFYCPKETFDKFLNTCNGVFINCDIDDEIIVDASRCQKELKEILTKQQFIDIKDECFQVIMNNC
jgi:hypothetical protein